MLTEGLRETVQQHLRLSRGLLGTTGLAQECSEFEERNALSRSYYTLFHSCSAWLLVRFGVEVRKLRHAEFHAEMQRRRGKQFGDFLRDVYGLRRAADYREDWKPARMVTEDRLNKVVAEALRLCDEAEAALSVRL